MRKEFIECKTLEEAQDLAPWAAEIIEADGGYMAFESSGDADVFASQK
ncbi:hypothetical protein [Eoetvoesiella caeni]|uniref:Uncharacterized protein n=1 Tax=Eoetvoesiella caeni TaxID=645616 RepID=A0A366HC55_9BURK|nr:hypothetical protein [Eoetvoesiella caeni]MCI2809406.1 hypothetical protein [Eoetvoesiella caeni]NYT54547.1 hypothetical protein [Eoetvoesiella caeni]RBP39263.1 hypothetical protein DFR37_10554 [Eoetvoesiella caeni]